MLVPCDLDGTSALPFINITLGFRDQILQFRLITTLILKNPELPGRLSLSSDAYFLISLIHSCGYDLINLFVSCTLLSLISAVKLQSD